METVGSKKAAFIQRDRYKSNSTIKQSRVQTIRPKNELAAEIYNWKFVQDDLRKLRAEK